VRRIIVVSFVLVAASVVPATAAQAQAPVNLAPPTIVSSPPKVAVVGATVNDEGSQWTAPVTALAIQWLECDRQGQSCAPILYATSQSYTVQAGNIGHTLRVQETASNGPDSATATSTPVPVGEFPHNTSPPVITGKPIVGATLTVSTGTWSGDASPMTFTYQWELCVPLCDDPIPGATGDSYKVPSSDAGRGLAVLVTASSDGGELSSEAYSQPVTIPYPVVRVGPSPFSGYLGGNPMIPSGQQSSLAYLLAHDGYRAMVAVTTIGRLEITWTTKRDHKKVTLASGQASYHTRGNHTFRLKLTRRGKTLLRTSRHLAFSDTAWYVTRNRFNLQWGECRYRGTETAGHALKFGSLNCNLGGQRPPRLSL
jgi:hypothetical protein